MYNLPKTSVAKNGSRYSLPANINLSQTSLKLFTNMFDNTSRMFTQMMDQNKMILNLFLNQISSFQAQEGEDEDDDEEPEQAEVVPNPTVFATSTRNVAPAAHVEVPISSSIKMARFSPNPQSSSFNSRASVRPSLYAQKPTIASKMPRVEIEQNEGEDEFDVNDRPAPLSKKRKHHAVMSRSKGVRSRVAKKKAIEKIASSAKAAVAANTCEDDDDDEKDDDDDKDKDADVDEEEVKALLFTGFMIF